MVDQGIQCVEMFYNLKQYDSYVENNDPNRYDPLYSSTYHANVGAFAGKQYKYTSSCKALKDKLQKTAFKKISSTIQGSFIETGDFEYINAPKQERSLEEAQPYYSNQNCLYCLPEAEVIDFLQGFYDGQTHLDQNMTALDIKTCLQNNEHFENAYFGGIQASLTKIMISYDNHNMQTAMDEIIRLQYDLENILDKKNCQALENLALMTNKLLASSVKVNGTKAFFTNEDDFEVDLSATPLLVSHLNQRLIQKQSEGTLSASDKIMYQMGEQIGLTTKVIHVRAKQQPSHAWMYACSAVSVLIFLSTVGFILYKRNKKANQTYEGVQNQETAI